MCLGHSPRKLKTPLVDRMNYWYRLERLSCPLLPLEPVSSLTGGCSGDDSLISPGRKEDPGWDLCLRGEHPCPCHQDPFLSTDSSYLYFIFRCSHTVSFCLFYFTEWNETHRVNHNAMVVHPSLFLFQQEEWKDMCSEVICKYLSWLFQFNYQIKKKIKNRQCHS